MSPRRSARHGRFLKVDPEVNNGVGHNRWVHCRFCGALNDIERRPVGDGLGMQVTDVATYHGTPLKYLSPSDVSIQLSITTLTSVMRLMKPDYDGVTVKESFQHDIKQPVAASGCWFCGSRAYY